MARVKRVFELAKELNVNSKAIVAKCKAEGVPDIDTFMSPVKTGLEYTIREWFSEERPRSSVNSTTEPPRGKSEISPQPLKSTSGTSSPSGNRIKVQSENTVPQLTRENAANSKLVDLGLASFSENHGISAKSIASEIDAIDINEFLRETASRLTIWTEMQIKRNPLEKKIFLQVKDCLRRMFDAPEDAACCARKIAEHGLDRIWIIEFGEHCIPDNVVKALANAGYENSLPIDGDRKLLHDYGPQVELLQALTGLRKNRKTNRFIKRIARKATSRSAILIAQLHAIGNWAHHRNGEMCSSQFVVSVAFLAVSLLDSLNSDASGG